MNTDQPGRVSARPRPGEVRPELVSRWQRGDAPPRPAAPVDRQAARILAAEQSIADALAHAQMAGVDPDIARTAFAVLRDCIAQVKECTEHAHRELSMARYEWGQARRRRVNRAPDSAAAPVVPDAPGFSLCPSPDAVQTPVQFMDTLRMYRIWAGHPSYRVMQLQCSNRFAASTICTALRSDDLPTQDMVRAVITACGGPEEHLHAFVSAWRRLKMPGQAAGQPPLPRPLYPMGETA
jgi:hypothetical protein